MVPAGHKVLKSTKESKVFIYYIDHGNRNIIAMPDDDIWSDELNEVLQDMNTKGLYGELLFYMTACHGGSMFANRLPEDIKIQAMTSASPNEVSYMTHCPPFDDRADGAHMNVCLGDVVSEIWATEAEKQDRSLSVGDHIANTKRAVTTSIVSSYGDTSFD
jgi:hypothetical protein